MFAAAARPAGPAGRSWFQSEYLHWWTRRASAPALAGFLTDPTDPTTLVVTFGNSMLNGGDHNGFRLAPGAYLDCCNLWAIEGDYFDLGRHEDDFNSGFNNGFDTSGATHMIVRPFYDPTLGAINVFPVSLPNLSDSALAGSLTIQTKDYFQFGRHLGDGAACGVATIQRPSRTPFASWGPSGPTTAPTAAAWTSSPATACIASPTASISSSSRSASPAPA